MNKVVHGRVGNRGLGVMRKPKGVRASDYRTLQGERLHRVIVEQRIGMKLPATAVVHHVNPDDKNTNNGPFVVCQDNAYHQIIERRGKALRECGHADWWKCRLCGKWDAPANLNFVEKTRHRGLNVSHDRWLNRCVNKGEGGKRDYRAKAHTEGIWLAIAEYRVRCLLCGTEVSSAIGPRVAHGAMHLREGTAVVQMVPARLQRKSRPAMRQLLVPAEPTSLIGDLGNKNGGNDA